MSVFAWHRLVFDLPPGLSPVKIEGAAQAGWVEFADLAGHRAALRWTTVRQQPDDCEDALYLPNSRRLIEWSGDEAIESPLPHLIEVDASAASPWRVFDLACLIPPGFQLTGFRLHVGDLSLSFTHKRRQIILRQLAAGALALRRRDLASWMREQAHLSARYHRPAQAAEPTTLTLSSKDYPALQLASTRRRRFAFLPGLPQQLLTLGALDEHRDRLILLHGTDEPTLRQVAATVGIQA